MSVYYIFMLFIIYSFIGWILEIIYTFFREKKFVNRGFLMGPYCPIYGIGFILILLLLNNYKHNPIVLFVMSMFICSILEYLTSYVLEKIFKARWWDYTDRKFDINGRICLELLIPFGLLGCIGTYYVNPFVISLLNKISFDVLKSLSIVLMILFSLDFIVSCGIITKLKLKSSKIILDNTEEITSKVKEYIYNNSWFGKRLIKSFPKIKINYNKKRKK